MKRHIWFLLILIFLLLACQFPLMDNADTESGNEIEENEQEVILTATSTSEPVLSGDLEEEEVVEETEEDQSESETAGEITLEYDLLYPEDLEYKGAFRLPGEVDEIGWAWSGESLAFYPLGDSDGPNDGYPGSLFGTGHNWNQYISEVSIPVPVISSNLADLPVAEELQPFTDIKKDTFGYLEIPRAGLAWLPAMADQDSGKLYYTWGQHMMEGMSVPSHGWINTDLSNPQFQGPYVVTGKENYVTTDYLFTIPEEWAETYVDGYRLATGRFRDGGQSAEGPSIVAVAPWLVEDGIPSKTLLQYTNVYDEEEHILNDYHHSDQWAGGEWLISGNSSAVIFAGTKGFGDCWYGFYDGTVWPNPEEHVGPGNRGWWSSEFIGQILFYDPNDLARVAVGQMEPFEPQPYAVLEIDQYLYNVISSQQYDHVGAVTFDAENGFLYIIEPLADEDKSIIHVWSIME